MSKVGMPVQYFPATTNGQPQDHESDVITNGNVTGPIAAVITRDWAPGELHAGVNLMVFPDFGTPVHKGSVLHKSAQATSTDGSWTSAYWDYIPS